METNCTHPTSETSASHSRSLASAICLHRRSISCLFRNLSAFLSPRSPALHYTAPRLRWRRRARRIRRLPPSSSDLFLASPEPQGQSHLIKAELLAPSPPSHLFPPPICTTPLLWSCALDLGDRETEGRRLHPAAAGQSPPSVPVFLLVLFLLVPSDVLIRVRAACDTCSIQGGVPLPAFMV